MDANRFDTLTRSLIAARSRRRALTGAIGGALGVLGWHAIEEAAAHNALTACKKKSGKAKKKCVKKAKAHNATHTTPASAPPPPFPTDPCPGQKPCDGLCIPTNHCCTDADCLSGGGYLCCNGVCSNTKLAANQDCLSHSECCSDFCHRYGNGIARCAETCLARKCTVAGLGCCREFACQPVASDGQTYCGGCKPSGEYCETDADCCFSSCTATPGLTHKHCFSYTGGRCGVNADCKACSAGGVCTVTVNGATRDICSGGVCRCPDATDECCANSDCPISEECEFDADGLNGVCQPRETEG